MKINLFNYTISIFKKKKKKKYTIYTGRTPPSSLDMPTAPSGYMHRWIRAETLGGDFGGNFKRSGFKLVKANKYRNRFPVIDKGRFKGFIGVGGLVLATIPNKMAEARREYLK